MRFFVTEKKLQAMSKKQIQANQEGQTQNILSVTYEELAKRILHNWTNQYTSYESQQQKIYTGYQSRADFGTSYIADVIDKRTNLIVSEGLSITANKDKTSKFIDNFIDFNKLDGSQLIEMVRISEMEGRILTLLYSVKDKDNVKIKIKNIRFRKSKYKLNTNPKDDDEIISVTLKNSLGEEQIYKEDKFTYLHNAISLQDDPNPCIAAILTNCEYADRALYDLRHSNHLFGFPTPNIETSDSIQQKQIQNMINNTNWKIGEALIGARLTFPQPPNSSELLKSEIALHLKVISSRTGIPVHWLGWTDLMSNRATALELRDFISICIKDEKIRIREVIRELIIKAMIEAVDNGVEGAVYDEDFEVDIPDVSIETVKALSETWLPLYDSKLISKFDMQNKISGINPLKTNKQIEKENKEATTKYTKGITQPTEDEDEEEETKDIEETENIEEAQDAR